MTIRLCLFDLDDTLVQTTELARHRGRENVNGGGSICTGALENEFRNVDTARICLSLLLNGY